MAENFVTVKDFKVTYRPQFGQGAFGRVCKAIDTRTNETVIAKEIVHHEDEEFQAQLLQDIQRELDIIIKLQNHKNIVRYIAHYEIDNACWIFMEFCDLRDLKCYLKKNIPLKLYSMINICYQAACGIAFMHHQEPPIVHRDIKLENILMKREGNETVLKICDFGFSRLHEEKTSASVVFMRPQSFRSLRGTPPFMAPEFSEEREGGLRYDSTVDVFALGLVFIVVLEPNDPHYFPMSVEMRAQGRFVSIGYEMIQNYKAGKPLPTIVVMNENDDPLIHRLKRIVRGMVQFKPRDRRPVHDVANELSEMMELIKVDAHEDQVETADSLPDILGALALSTTKESTVAATALLGARFDKCVEYDIASHCNLIDRFLKSNEMDESMEITRFAKNVRPLIPLLFSTTSVGDDIIDAGDDDLTLHCKQGQRKKIAPDEYESVNCQGSKLFACKIDAKNIDVFDLNTLSQICTYEVPCQGDEDGEHLHSIMVSTGRLYIACGRASQTFIMDMTGRILKTYGKTKINGLRVNSPVLCKIPLDNGVVIADVENNRLIMLHEDTWSVLKLQPQPVSPWGAAFIENILYVISVEKVENEDKVEDEGEDEADEQYPFKIVKYIPAPHDTPVTQNPSQAEGKPTRGPKRFAGKKCIIQ